MVCFTYLEETRRMRRRAGSRKEIVEEKENESFLLAPLIRYHIRMRATPFSAGDALLRSTFVPRNAVSSFHNFSRGLDSIILYVVYNCSVEAIQW